MTPRVTTVATDAVREASAGAGAGAGAGAERKAPPLSTHTQLTTFLDLSAQIFCITDFTGSLLWWNAAFERTLGYSPEELRGLSLDDLVHPDDRAVRKAAEVVLAETGEAGLTQIRFCTRAGEWRWLEWTTRVDFERQRVYGAARDITERRRDETALAESEARLRAIMEYSPSVIFVKDLEGRYLLVNDEFARAAGITVEAAVGLTAVECWPEDTDTITGRERELVDGGASFVSDERRTTVDGPRDFMVSRFLIRDEAGTPFAIGGIASDTTERRNAERALAARDRLLDSVIGASPDMITLMDRAGKIHQISEAESALFGHRHEVFTRSDVFDFVHPDDFDDVASLFIRLVTGAVSHLHLRYRARHAEGHWVTVDSRAQAVLDGEGHFAGSVVVSRDISDKLESEQRLQTSRESAEKASKAKSDFLSRMSHELRTPLNSILGFAQLLQMDDIPGQQLDAVDHILRAGRHLLDLIDEVLDIARIESGYLELALTPVAVSEIVSDAVELTDPMAARAEVVIRSSIDPRNGYVVTADRQRLMQVLLNLLSNAVKYNKPGGRVDVTCAPGRPGRLRLAVADTGRGIRAEDLDRVFVPFDRLGLEQTGIEGTGVGLALSQHLCERMGGELGLESVADVGSTFVIELPVPEPADGAGPDDATGALTMDGTDAGTAIDGTDGIAATDIADATATTDGAGARAATHVAVTTGRERSNLGRDVGTTGNVGSVGVTGDVGVDPADQRGPARTFRVLLVENNLTTLDLVERVLSRRPGTEVLPAMQGGLGVDLAREHVPDMILLDLYLPDMTGDVVLDRLGEDPVTAEIPVAVIGAEAPAQHIRQLLGRGVIGFLAKPIDVRGLLSLVDAVRAARGT
jgi:PAS domain S-box-containing protein